MGGVFCIAMNVCLGVFVFEIVFLCGAGGFRKKPGNTRGIAVCKRRIMYIMYSLVCGTHANVYII